MRKQRLGIVLVFALGGIVSQLWATDLGEEMPPAPSPPNKVTVNFYFNSLHRINNQTGSFEPDFYLNIKWFDPTLLGKTEDEIDWDTVWNPQIECTNSPNYTMPYEPLYELEGPGQVLCVSRIRGDFFTRFDLRRFPFDVQMLPIVLESANYENEDLEIHFEFLDQPVSVNFGESYHQAVDLEGIFSPEISLTEWEIRGTTIVQTVNYLPFEDSYWSQFRIESTLARRPHFYVWNIIVMIILLVILAWIIPFMDPKELGPRVGASISLFMAAVAFNLVASRILPHIPYLTLLDYYVKINQAVIVLVAVESLIVNIFYKKYLRQDKEEYGFEKAKRIDRKMQIAIPTLFIGACSLIWWIVS